MSTTGDLVNNLGKLEKKLKQINFRNFRRSELLSGTLDIYVSIYGFVFSEFNRELSKLIASHGLELYGKTSKRFVDNLYLIVRDILHYKPPITKDMFLTNCGFVEMKMITCTQILELVLAKCKELPACSSSKKKNYRKNASTTTTTNGKNDNIKENNDNNTEYVIETSNDKTDEQTGVVSLPSQSKISTIQNIKSTNTKTLGATKSGNTSLLPSSSTICHRYLKRALLDKIPSEILRHSNNCACALSKNPVSKCNMARFLSHSKGNKAVVLEKQESPPEKVDIKVLKGPQRVDDGFSGVLKIIPQEVLNSDNILLYRDYISSNLTNLVTYNSNNNQTPEESITSHNTTSITDSSATDTTKNTAHESESLISIQQAKLKDRNISRSQTSSSNIATDLKCPPGSRNTTPIEIDENSLAPKTPHGNNREKEINFICGNSHTQGKTTATDLKNPNSSSTEKGQAAKVLSQIKNLSQHLEGCTETLRQMQERNWLWNVQNSVQNCSDQNKENSPTLGKETLDREVRQDFAARFLNNGTEENKDKNNHQVDYFIAKMNLMECTMKSLESKFKSL